MKMFDFVKMRQLIKQAPRLQFQVEKAVAKAEPGSPVMNDMPHGSAMGDKIEQDIIRLTEVTDAYAEVLTQLSMMRRQLMPLIGMLTDPDEKAVMRLRYIQGHSPEVIAESRMVPMARMTVYRALRRAQTNIQRMSQVGIE